MLEMQSLAALPFPCYPPLFQRNEAETLNPEGLLKRLLASLQVIQSLELAVPTTVKDVPTRDSKILILDLCLKEILTRCSRRPLLSIRWSINQRIDKWVVVYPYYQILCSGEDQ